MAGLTPAPGKACGDCSLCCKTLVIPELNKPKDSWCPHYARGLGCDIYNDRPPSCRDFSCHWLIDPTLGPEWKPNKCKMVLHARDDALAVHVDPGAPQPWRREPFYSQLLEKSARNIDRGAMVLVIEHGRTTIILPDRGVDLGVIGPGDQIALAKTMTPTGPIWQARLVRA